MLHKFAKLDAEAEMCIVNNLKHAPYIKEFKFNEKLLPQRAIQLFETFKYISNLTIEGVSMVQDQFITIITTLTQLQELNIKHLSVSKVMKNSYATEPAVLSQSLKKLNLGTIYLYKNPELFVQTINSHGNLKELRFDDNINVEFLRPLFRNYPTLKTLGFNYIELDQYQTLIKIFEHNPQLTSLIFEPSSFNSNFLSGINLNLKNLEELSLTECIYNNRESSPIISKFSHPTKIKKLKLDCDRLSECSINSILLNCPKLEELSLSRFIGFNSFSWVKDISLLNSVNLKKLYINCNRYTESSYNSILLKCSHLKQLEIILPKKRIECIKLIGSVCSSLEKLTIWPSCSDYFHESNTFYHDLNEFDNLTGNSLCKSTITHLTFYRLNIYESKAEYFSKFQKLRYIEYKNQYSPNGLRANIKPNFDKNLWPNYRLDIKINKHDWDGKLVKLNS